MFKIESGIKNGGIWDGRKLLRFKNGALETNDATLAGKCEADGYTVTGGAEKPPGAAAPGKFLGMGVEQLKAYASANGIEIGNSTSVNGIIKKITDAEAAKGQEIILRAGA